MMDAEWLTQLWSWFMTALTESVDEAVIAAGALALGLIAHRFLKAPDRWSKHADDTGQPSPLVSDPTTPDRSRLGWVWTGGTTPLVGGDDACGDAGGDGGCDGGGGDAGGGGG